MRGQRHSFDDRNHFRSYWMCVMREFRSRMFFLNVMTSALCRRDAMLARVPAMALCLLSVSVCLCRKSVFYRKGWTDWSGGFLYHSYTVLLGNSGIHKSKRLEVFCHSISVVKTCYQLSSRKVDARSVINWTVVGQLSWQYLRATTFDRCSLSQWSSSSVYSTMLLRGSSSNSCMIG